MLTYTEVDRLVEDIRRSIARPRQWIPIVIAEEVSLDAWVDRNGGR